jgi:hypothetical protein
MKQLTYYITILKSMSFKRGSVFSFTKCLTDCDSKLPDLQLRQHLASGRCSLPVSLGLPRRFIHIRQHPIADIDPRINNNSDEGVDVL